MTAIIELMDFIDQMIDSNKMSTETAIDFLNQIIDECHIRAETLEMEKEAGQ